MLTICWAAKGGSGTTVTAAGLALTHPTPTLLVDLAGDLPLALGLPEPPTPGVVDWLAADAPVARLSRLEVPVGRHLNLLPLGLTGGLAGGSARPERWRELAGHLANDERAVVVDAGTGPPPGALAAAATHRLIVVRNCYLNLRTASRSAAGAAPSGVIVVEEPGRRIGVADIEYTLGAPVVAVVLADPAVGRAADSGLALGRVPASLRRPMLALATPSPALDPAA